ncbi:MAG: hypothetical protein WDO17_02025 [Alphaproteobacteria bacterium]
MRRLLVGDFRNDRAVPTQPQGLCQPDDKITKIDEFGDILLGNAALAHEFVRKFTTKPNFGQGRAVVGSDKQYS